MEGKLIKTSIDSYHNGHYFLNDSDGFAIGSTDKDWCKRAVSKRPLYILSLKNCETIENGYDLDELIEEEAKKRHDWYKHSDTDIYNQLVREDAELIKIGFQKALEILGDKKFNYGHLDKMFTCGKLYQDSKNEAYCFDNVLNKFQQAEWDVIIEMECPECKEYGYVYECRNNCNQKFLQPKLDSDGCLILKRK